jgi:hypothetical protein
LKDHEILKVEVKDWPLPDDYLLELGRLGAMWSTLEAAIDLYVGKLAGFNDPADPTSFILLKHSSFPQKLDALSALCEHLKASFPLLSGYGDVVSKIRSVQKARNRFVHNGLNLNADTKRVEIAEGSARGKVKTSVSTVSIADIRRVTFDTHVVLLDLHKLVTGKAYPPMWKNN